MADGPEDTTDARIVRQWQRAGPLLAARRRDELRALTDVDGRVAALQLLALAGRLPRKQGSSGLVEQQRLFRRARP